jgi:glycosyltransferase involved in cell wall biosynthesis
MTTRSPERTLHPFRLVCVLEDYSAVAGGVPAVVNQLSHRVAEQGNPVHLLYLRGGGMPSSSGIELNCIPSTGLGSSWGWSPHLRRNLDRLALLSGPTVFHLHGIWTAPQFVAAKVARERSIPSILSAHGMLKPWLWDQQGWKVRTKKQLYWKMLAYPAFNAASVVHAITPLECQHLRVLFPSIKIEVIPNAIDLDEYPKEDDAGNERQKLILFLGRIEPVKGVDILLRAFAQANIGRDWRLGIIGPMWSPPYKAVLEQIVTEYNLAGRVDFVGPVFGDEKLRYMRKAWVMAVPSHSEVVGLVNLEAAACLLPTITTHQTGLSDWESGGGLLIQPNVGDMKKALEDACSWSDSERTDRGLASRSLVADRYSWKVVMPLWMSLYDSIM